MKTYLAMICCLAAFIAKAQHNDSLPVHILVKQDKFEVKVNGKNIGAKKYFMVSPGMNRISVYTPYVGVFDTVMNFTGSINEQRLAARINEIPEYREEKSKRNWQIARALLGGLGFLVAPASVKWAVEARKDYDAGYTEVQRAAHEYETAVTRAEIKKATDRLQDADENFLSIRKKYVESVVFSSVGMLMATGGLYICFTSKVPGLEDRARIQFDAITLRSGEAYPGLKLTLNL